MKLNSESIFFNPAATAFQDSKFDLSVGAAGILSYCTYTPSPTMENGFYSGNRPEWESDNEMSTPIYAYFNYKPSDRWAVGLGFFTPNGSSMNWGDDWPGANLVQEINLAAYTVQPTVSFCRVRCFPSRREVPRQPEAFNWQRASCRHRSISWSSCPRRPRSPLRSPL